MDEWDLRKRYPALQSTKSQVLLTQAPRCLTSYFSTPFSSFLSSLRDSRKLKNTKTPCKDRKGEPSNIHTFVQGIPSARTPRKCKGDRHPVDFDKYLYPRENPFFECKRCHLAICYHCMFANRRPELAGTFVQLDPLLFSILPFPSL